MEQLMDKLIKAKAIMDMEKNISKPIRKNYDEQIVSEDYEIPNVRYNIPSEYLSETKTNDEMFFSPKQNTKPVGVPTVDAIKNSKLPEEIKKLMIEHPISQPQQPQTTLSDEMVEKATRLMNVPNKSKISESPQNIKKSTQDIDYNLIKNIVEEVVSSVLKKNGLIVEGLEKTNEVFTFRVGKHVFEGKISKIKKVP